MKFLYQPLSPFVINQRFAENKACVDTLTGRKTITCDGLNPPSGYRSLYGPKGHSGLDLRAKHGQPVYNSFQGTVLSIDTEPRSGLDVRVLSYFNKRTYLTVYEHLLGYQPQVGQFVDTGDLIGWADNSGYSSGDHLHFEVKELVNDQWVPIDPLPLMEDMFALDAKNGFKRILELLAILSDSLADYLRR